jgi:hypothetical protein
VAALVFVPGLWARQLLERHNARDQEDLPKGHELARQILDLNGLQRVRVECTDMGDHYDPEAKAVRLARDKYDRRTLAAVTTAAHEAFHAVQDAADYAPFVWRTRLAYLARVTGQVGTTVLIAVPAAALLGRQPIPQVVVEAALFAMLATGVAVQLAALPTELDASFRRALPLLQAGYLDQEQVEDARSILLATSSTYVAASLLSVLNIWPRLGTPRVGVPLQAGEDVGAVPAAGPVRKKPGTRGRRRATSVRQQGAMATTLRVLGKPLIRGWLQASKRVNA